MITHDCCCHFTERTSLMFLMCALLGSSLEYERSQKPIQIRIWHKIFTEFPENLQKKMKINVHPLLLFKYYVEVF